MFGLLNINKPPGVTSRDVVNQVQRLVRPTKVGHTGTLDPLATGVLVLCLGPATRLISYVQAMPKRYCGTFLLGRSSDTEDVEGEVTELNDAPIVALEQIQSALPGFIGQIDQRPPAYSALKVKGKRAYELARAGKAPELEPRPVTIHNLQIVRFNYPELVLDITCGSGTYVRSLGRDIAAKLGTAAVMSALDRTAVGGFVTEDALSLEDLASASLVNHLLDPILALADMPRISLSRAQTETIQRGQFIEIEGETCGPEIAAVDQSQRLVAILVPRGKTCWGAAKNFVGNWQK